MRLILPVLLLVLSVSPVSATDSGVMVVDDLGMVSTPVGNRSEDARGEALQAGLEEVLVRITGRLDIAGQDGAAALLEEPGRWLEQYGYAESEDGLVLESRYNVAGLSAELARAGHPLWGETRPVVLVWLVDKQGDIVARDDQQGLRQAVARQAEYRGLPLDWPLMDGEDREAIVAADIRGRFDRQLAEASARYSAALQVTGVIYDGNPATLRWRILQDQETLAEERLTDDSGAEEDLGRALVDAVADHLAGIYAVEIGDGTGLVLRVEQIGSLAAYDSVRRHVVGLAGMQEVHLLGLNGTQADFELAFSGPPLQLERLLHLHGSLGPCEEMAKEQQNSGVLRVCWSTDD